MEVFGIGRTALFWIFVVIGLDMIQIALICRNIAAREAAESVTTTDTGYLAFCWAIAVDPAVCGDSNVRCAGNPLFGGDFAELAHAVDPSWSTAHFAVDINDNLGIG